MRKYRYTIGLLGGMGSYATLDFFGRVLEAFPAEKEWERPRIIIDNKCTMPSRVRAILYKECVDELVGELTESITCMEKCAEKLYIIIVCNTCHYFLPLLQEKFPNVHFIDIIDAFAHDINNKDIREIFLLASEGTIQAKIYEKYLMPYGILIKYPDNFETIRYFIECVKQHKITVDDEVLFEKYINEIELNTVALGCTELPVLAKRVKSNKILVDPLESALQRLKLIME